jgi:hypothetical protein
LSLEQGEISVEQALQDGYRWAPVGLCCGDPRYTHLASYDVVCSSSAVLGDESMQAQKHVHARNDIVIIIQQAHDRTDIFLSVVLQATSCLSWSPLHQCEYI